MKCQDHLGTAFNSKKDMCNVYGITREMFNERIKAGFTLEEALTMPVNENPGVKINRKYKDSLFTMIFKDNDEALLELCNAFLGTNYTDAENIVMTTLEDVVYINVKNDLSFIIHEELMVVEHQSTINENIPLRSMEYCLKIFNKAIASNGVRKHQKSRVMLPSPHCIVLYNGSDKASETEVYKLSDSFKNKNTGCEWTVVVYNINKGYNKHLLSRCATLKDYSDFIDKIREYKKIMSAAEAVEKAIIETINANNTISGILAVNRSEVKDMFLTTASDMDQYEQELIDKGIAIGIEQGIEQGIERGIEQGIEQGTKQGIEQGRNDKLMSLTKKKLAKNKSVECIADELEEDVDVIRKLIERIKNNEI